MVFAIGQSMPRPEVAEVCFEVARVGDSIVLRFGGQAQSAVLEMAAPEAEVLAGLVVHVARASDEEGIDTRCRLRLKLQTKRIAPKSREL